MILDPNVFTQPERIQFLEQISTAWSIIPLDGVSKAPIERDWTKYCRIHRQFNKNEFINSNAGITTGPFNGLLVLDIDNVGLFNHMAKKFNLNLPQTFVVQTGKNGYHYYFQYPEDKSKQYNNKSIKVLGVDLRGNGGMVVAPYSIHPDTKNEYKIINNSEIAPLPEWILALYDTNHQQLKCINFKSLKIPDQAKYYIEHGAEIGSRSEAIWHVLRELIAAKLFDTQIIYYFYTYPIGNKVIEKEEAQQFDFLEGEIKRARESLNIIEPDVSQESRNAIYSIEFITGEQLLNSCYIIDPVISGLLDRGDGMVFIGPTGLGKSLLSLNLALEVANPNKGNLWGRFPIHRPLTVAFLQSENSEARTCERINKICQGNQYYVQSLPNIFFPRINHSFRIGGLSMGHPQFEYSIKYILGDRQIDILIVDPLESFINFDENDNAKMRLFLDYFNSLCSQFGTSLVILHHSGKQGNQGVYTGRGASSIAGWASSVVVMAKQELKGSSYIVLNFEKTRYSGNHTPLYLYKNDYHIMVPYNPSQAIGLEELKKLFLENKNIFNKKGDFIAALTKALNCNDRLANAYIKEFKSKGWVKESPTGKHSKKYELLL